MTAIILRRIDPAKNMRRFYMLDVQPDLCGAWCLIREWGPIGRAGQVRTVSYPTAAEAHDALAQQREHKKRREYYPRPPSLSTPSHSTILRYERYHPA